MFSYLKVDARPDSGTSESGWCPEGYRLRAHPELFEFLHGLIDAGAVVSGYAYGVPVLANTNGLIFAWAGGTHSIFVRLRREHHGAARLDNGTFDPTYGNDWIEFRVGGLKGGPADWRASMKRWISVSYQDSLEEG